MFQVIAAGRGMLVVVRRPTECHHASEFLPCNICYGFFLRKTLSNHVKSCRLATKGGSTHGGGAVKHGVLLLMPFFSEKSESNVDRILKGLRDTNANGGELFTMLFPNV